MLLATLLAVLLHVVTGCQNNQLYFGLLSSSLEIDSVTLPQFATSCNCCGLCHKNAACKSLAFHTDSRQCILYSNVGGPVEFDRDYYWSHKNQFFFMPGSSLTNEFCRSDSDCITEGDFCRGRICTADTIVTCRDLYLFNSDLPDHRYWGYISGQEILLECKMGSRGGFTKLVTAWPSGDWTTSNRLNRTSYLSDGTAYTWSLYSILWAADIIRDSSPESSYRVFIEAHHVDKRGSDRYQDWIYHYRNIFLTAPKEVSLLDRAPREMPYTVESNHAFAFSDGSQVSFPYLLDNGGDILLHANMRVGSEFGGIIRTSGPQRWASAADYPSSIRVFIRE